MRILLIDNENDYDVADVHGPFVDVASAQRYARRYRELNGIPGHDRDEPTAEENEAWSAAGWYFGIFEPKADPRATDRAVRMCIQAMLDEAWSADELKSAGWLARTVEEAVNIIEAHPQAASVRDIPEED